VKENENVVYEDEDGNPEMSGTSNINEDGLRSWRCFDKHIKCGQCPQDPYPERVSDVTRLWSCDCGIVCSTCNDAKTITEWPEELERRRVRKERKAKVAWVCKCGSILCGVCKVFLGEDNAQQ
jgi:hypothetical protein